MKPLHLNTKPPSQHREKQSGVTLIELVVAMAVSSIVILGISNIYLSTKKASVVHDEFARIQENGRYTMESLSTNIRNAGFFGCASGLGIGNIRNGLNQSNTILWNFETGLMGFEADGTDINDVATITPTVISGNQADWTTVAGTSSGVAIAATVPASVMAFAVAGSDILIIRTTDGLGARIAQNNSGAQVFVEDTTNGADANGCISGICQDDILLVSDCANSRIFQAGNIQAVGGGPGACGGALPCFNLTHPAAGDPGNADVVWNADVLFGPNAEIIRVITKIYFVGIPVNGGEPSLYVQENQGAPQQLVEGIENIQILYGVDTSGDGIANQYFSAHNVPDVDGNTDSIFDGVVSVKLSILARTPQNLPGINRTAAELDNLAYAMVSPAAPITIDPIAAAGAIIAGTPAADQRMRKVFNLTIQVRNKSFNLAN